MRILFSIIFTVISLSRLPAYAQNNQNELFFEHIGLERGLDNNTVIGITQDSDGNMWFITKTGVNRYDGYNMRVEQIRAKCIANDEEGGIWLGTDEGLCHYDPELDHITSFPYATVLSMVDIGEGRLLASTPSGLVVFNQRTSSFDPQPEGSPMYSLVATSLLFSDGTLYIGTANGVYSCSISGESLRRIIPTEAAVHQILIRNQTELWVASEGRGLFKQDMYSGSTTSFHCGGRSGDISSNFVRSLAVSQDGELWVGTYNGLDILRPDGTFGHYRNSPSDNSSLSHNSIRAIYTDSQGGIWLGTYFGGVNYTHKLRNRFTTMLCSTAPNSLSGKVTSCIKEDGAGNLWIGSNDTGLDMYDVHTGKYTNYKFQPFSVEAPFRDIKAIYIDESADIVYIGAHAGGMMAVNRKTGAQRSLNTSNSSLGSNNVYGIEDAGDGGLWIATLDGLYHFDRSTEIFTPVLKDLNGIDIERRILGLFKDRQGRLFLLHTNGFSMFEKRGRELSRTIIPSDCQEIQKATINSVCQGSDGTIWMATDRGLWEMSPTGQFSMADGVPSSIINSVCEDTNGALWFSTINSISRIDPSTNALRTYSSRDGLAQIQFNARCGLKAGNGDLLFGGINGIIRFNPDMMTDNPYSPKPVIDRLTVSGVEVRPCDDTGILSKSVSKSEKIILKSNQNSFSIGFHVVNFIAGTHNSYSYKLEGFDKKWNSSDGGVPAVYMNIPGGRYTFVVRASNNDGVSNTEPAVLKIRVKNVWYKSWWFLCLVVLGVAALLFIALNVFWEKKSMMAELEREKNDRENQKMLSEMQIRFYINISHELRTPLTLIISPLQDLQNHAKGYWEKEKLAYIQRNTTKLLHMVNQLLDYRRAELGIFALKVEKANAYRRLLACFDNYVAVAKRKNIDYTLTCDIQDEDVSFDVNYFDIIANNLLSNAFKYTGFGKSISVRLTIDEGKLLLQVSDTGIGIDSDKQKRIFERFYQASENSVGSGIGLSLVKTLVDMHHGYVTVESELGVGSTFKVFLPQNLSLYTPEEFAEVNGEDNGKHFHSNDIIDVGDDIIDETDSARKIDPGKKDIEKRGKLLVVEDNAELRGYIAKGLSDLFDIVTAENGAEALDYLREGEADIVISDVMMPEVDGLQLCRSIKQNSRTSHIPVFLLSAMAESGSQLDGLHVGADDYIPKPFSLDVLKAKALNSIVTQKRNRMRLASKVEVRPEEVATNTRDEDLLRRAISIIEKNIDNTSFSTDELAHELCMSRSNLHLKMKAITGKPATDLIHKVRFGRACQLLENGDYTVSEISYMVGFSSASYFASRFRKYVGCLPTEYCKKQ